MGAAGGTDLSRTAVTVPAGTPVGASGDAASSPALARRRRTRHRVLCVPVTLAAILYIARLWQLQIIEVEDHREKQLAQSAEWEVLPAPRGRLMDREGRILAAPDTRHQAFLAVDELLLSREEALEAVASVVPVAADRHRAIETAGRGWLVAARDVSYEERLQMQRLIGRGIHFESYPARDYPRGSMGRRLIGSVGADGRGLTGLEAEFDDLLAGEPGRAEVRMDARRNAHRPPGGQVIEARHGHDVVLTIDAELQRIAENELARAIAETGASGGDMVLLDPRTGEILALASEQASGAPDQVSALTDPFEPGSTAKPFLLAALLSEGLADLDEVIDVEGGRLRSGSRVIEDVYGYGALPVRQVISKSSNVGVAKLARRIAPSVQHRYLRDFGFGMRTLDYLSESPGRLRRAESWTSLSPASHAMGYEMSVTSLQLIAAYGAIANDGVLMKPALIREVRDPSGRRVRHFEPQITRRAIPAEVAREVRSVLEEVVREGTGTLARMTEFAVAGKTGTARLAVGGGYAPGRYRASFVGFAPADDPRIVVMTRLEDPQGGVYYGGAIAAPASQAVLKAALATDGVQIDPRLVVADPLPRPWSRPAPAARNESWPVVLTAGGVSGVAGGSAITREEPVEITLPNVTGLSPRAAAARLHELGLRVEWRGRGAVGMQSPEPGSEVAVGETVVLK